MSTDGSVIPVPRLPKKNFQLSTCNLQPKMAYTDEDLQTLIERVGVLGGYL